MNRREFVRLAGMTAVSAGATATGARAAPSTRPGAATRGGNGGAAAHAAPFGPVLTNVAADSVTVLWGAGQPATGWVEYGLTEQLGHRADGADGGLLPCADRALSVRLTGLAPGTKYFYRTHTAPVDFASAYNIRRGPEASAGKVGTFTTLDPAAPEARFAVWNDTHEHHETVRRLTGLSPADSDFLFWNGDVVNSINAEAEIPAKYLDPAAGRPYADRVPVLFSRGNHDVRGAAARDLPRYVNGPDGRYHYFFRHGPVAFVVLDTGEDKPDDSPAYAGLAGFDAYREQQRIWLESVVKEDAFRSAPFRVVFAHIPLVWDALPTASFVATYGTHRGWVCDDGLKRWGKLLEDGRVDLVISGHTHHPNWFPARPGRPWGQLVGGGPQLERATLIDCHATADALALTMTNIGTGQVLVNDRLPRRT